MSATVTSRSFQGAWLLLSTLLIVTPLTAFSQSNIIEEIVVTAERRESTLQETPISISAFTTDDLRRAGIQTSQELADFTPGLVIQRDIIGKVVIRGIGAENFTIAGDPGVAINFDEAYIARSSAAIFDMYDMKRVEVLRGPQGTLYGRNATGGAINFISNKPTEEFEATVLVDVGDYDKARVEGAIGGTLVQDKLLGRLSGLVHQRDGYTDNVFPNVGRGLDELDSKDLWAARGQLTWLPTDSLNINIKADIYQDDSNPQAYKYTDDPLVFLGGVPFDNPLAPELFTVSQGFEFNIPGSTRTVKSAGTWDQWGLLGTVDWDISDGLTLRSITSYREIDFEWLNDGDGIEAYLVNYFQVDESEQISQEFQLISDTDGSWSWLAGLFYLNEDSTAFHGIPLPLGFDLPLFLLIDGTNETTAYAAFGEVSYNFTEQLRLTLGARYSYEEKDTVYVDDRFGVVTDVSQGDDWNSFTPKIALDWFLSDASMLYGSITKGFKSGGFNLLAVQPGYDEEEVWSFEVGTKNRFRDGRMQLNASVFYYDYDDLQVGKVVEFQATIQNAAKATIYGAEIELSTLITDNFQLDWGVSLLDTEYDEFITQDPAPPGDVVNLAGNELPRSPPVTSTLSGRYDWQLGGGGGIELWGHWLYVDDQFFTQFNRSNVAQDSYNVFNARISYRTPGQSWRFTLYGNNLSDEEYFTNALESGVPAPGVDPVVPQFFLGAPRMWGVQVAYSYGGN